MPVVFDGLLGRTTELAVPRRPRREAPLQVLASTTPTFRAFSRQRTQARLVRSRSTGMATDG